MTDCWVQFYRRNAARYAYVAGNCLQSAAISSSHPRLTGDWDLLERLVQLAPGPKGLDAGCGAGARDVRRLMALGYDIVGIDAIEEAVSLTHEIYPELRGRVFTSDLREPLPFDDQTFDFALCVSVLQHIKPEVAHAVTLPELARLLRAGGILLLGFKRGEGIVSVYDPHYGEDRHFLLHDEHEVLRKLYSCGMNLFHSPSSEELGGLMYCSDVKGMRYCALFAVKGYSQPFRTHSRRQSSCAPNPGQHRRAPPLSQY